MTNAALTEMTGATSPRLHLELMVARLLVPRHATTPTAVPSPGVERLERRVGVEGRRSRLRSIADSRSRRSSDVRDPTRQPRRVVAPSPRPAEALATSRGPQRPPQPATPVTFAQVRDSWPEILEAVERERKSAWAAVYTSTPRALEGDVLTLELREPERRRGVQAGAGPTASSEVLRKASSACSASA